jgi:2-phosphosulfolactate phosphatase
MVSATASPPKASTTATARKRPAHAAGKRVIFTTTTGANRLVHCWGARAAYMGSPVNARAVVQAAVTHGCDVVVIPAGLTGHLHFDAQEDWAGAAFLAQCANAVVGEGRARCDYWKARIASEGLTTLFETAPHATQLRHLGLDSDIPFCAQVDLTEAVPSPWTATRTRVLLRNANA